MKGKPMPNLYQPLYDKISQLNSPTEKHGLLVIVDELSEKNKTTQDVLKLIRGALIDLRLEIKYLVFDLEATRRERDKALGK